MPRAGPKAKGINQFFKDLLELCLSKAWALQEEKAQQESESMKLTLDLPSLHQRETSPETHTFQQGQGTPLPLTIRLLLGRYQAWLHRLLHKHLDLRLLLDL